MATIIQKRHRLADDYYRSPCKVSFTACIVDRCPTFVHSDIVSQHELILRSAAGKHHCDLDVYLFMPDHLHVIVSSGHTGDVLAAMKLFKQRSGYAFVQSCKPHRWQKDFFDRIIRSDDEYRRLVRYILDNPVRAGLVERWQDYAFKGSTTFDLNSWDPRL